MKVPSRSFGESKAQLLPLTGMRCFLALWVVVFHQTSMEGYLGASLPRLPETLFCLLRTGYLAVGVFFVLSGFVLSYNYSLAHSWSYSELVRFFVARFARIYPAYCAGLILVAPFVGYSMVNAMSVAKVEKQTVLAVLNWTLLQSWIPQAALSWNSPGWSLSNEAFFYCCFPFIGVALWRMSHLRSLVVAGALIWAAALVLPLLAVGMPLSGFGNVPATSLHPNANPFWANLLKFNPLLRIPDFCIGIVIGRAYHALRGGNSGLLGRGYYLYAPGMVLEILAILRCNSLPYPLVHNGLLTPLHALVILGLALGGGVPARLLSIQPLIFLGNASYSMYILHSPAAQWMNLISVRLFSTRLSGFVPTALYVMVVVCLSAVVFKAVEEPCGRILKNKLTLRLDVSRRRNRAAALAAC